MVDLFRKYYAVFRATKCVNWLQEHYILVFSDIEKNFRQCEENERNRVL